MRPTTHIVTKQQECNFWKKVSKTESCWLWQASKDSKGNGYREKTHCIRGHEFTPENARRQNGNGRLCITCKVSYDKARYEAGVR